MKLKDFRDQLREAPKTRALDDNDQALRLGRHPSGAVFSIDVGIGGDETVYTTMRREVDGSTTLLSTGRVHKLHDFAGVKDSGSYHVLAAELIEPRAAAIRRPTSRARLRSVGKSFFARYAELYGRTWKNEDDISEEQLGRITVGTRHKRTIPDTDGSVLTEHVAAYLMFCDNAYRQPMLCRYLRLGVEGGKPVIFVQCGNDGRVHVGHGACFYPAETVPCLTCKETGTLDREAWLEYKKPTERPGGPCPYCSGLGRVFRCRPWRHPEADEPRPLTFAAANPRKWRGKRI